MSNILHNPESLPRADVLRHVSENLRSVRSEKEMSQAQLAAATGLSRRMISAIESGAANVSLATVDKLAAALNVAFTKLVRNPLSPDTSKIETVGWRGKHPSSIAKLLGSAPGSTETELWLWSLAAGERFDSEAIAGTWHEVILVLEGQLTIALSEGSRVLGSNAFTIFTSPSPYHFRNDGTELARYARILVL